MPCHVHNSRVFDTITPLHANSQQKRCFSDLVFLHPPAASEAHYRKGLRRQMIRSSTIHTLVLEPTSIQCSSVKVVPCHVHNSRMFDTITPLHANSQQKRCFSDLVFLHSPAASEAHYRKGLRRQMIRSNTIHTLVLQPTSIQCSSVKAVPCHVHNSRSRLSHLFMQTRSSSVASPTWCSCILLQLPKLLAEKVSRAQRIRLDTAYAYTGLQSCNACVPKLRVKPLPIDSSHSPMNFLPLVRRLSRQSASASHPKPTGLQAHKFNHERPLRSMWTPKT